MSSNERDQAQELQAAEFVLGTLPSQERRRLERDMQFHYALREKRYQWEARLAPLAEALPPIAPEPGVWDALAARIADQKVTQLKRRNRWTAGWALAATAASSALAALLFLQPRPEPQIQIVERAVEPQQQRAYVALLKMADVDMHWTVSLNPEANQVQVRAGGTPPEAAAALDTELWWLGPDGPVSMGVIPKSGSRTTPLPKPVTDLDNRQLAVSLEPRGGSPSGAPTGPVIAVGDVLRAI